MTLFGATLDGAQIAALVGLLATLALWFIVLGRERGYAKWFRHWEADRKARLAAEQGKNDEPKREPTGPWG
ncbi:hypothetical protein [Brevundimonas sp. NIBR11]|uniref:hypothetical protein n=1 Tax=Brevundimonas sp. NIBR11 TaxID=3015999 RepID=UPI0022F03DAA|nr:hypothetical protein [Brevundimonas sp. NIBR11]WGM31300.1 hypothetical protein KKHFBJBL_01544 [Brevundimonas sp. NIBR11]